MPYPPHTFDDLRVGARFEAGPRTIQREDIDAFARVSGDHMALHTDEAYAASTPLGGLVAHGVLNLAVATGLAYSMGIFDGTILAVTGMEIAYKRPVRPGDAVTLTLEVSEVDPRPRPGRGRARFAADLRNQDGKTVLDGSWSFLLSRTPT